VDSENLDMIYMFSLQASIGIKGRRTPNVKVKASFLSKQRYHIADSCVIIRLQKCLHINLITFFLKSGATMFTPLSIFHLLENWIWITDRMGTLQKSSSRKTSISVTLFPSQIPHGLSQDRTPVPHGEKPQTVRPSTQSRTHVLLHNYVLLLPNRPTCLRSYLMRSCTHIACLNSTKFATVSVHRRRKRPLVLHQS